jgi:hypothetical protein
MVIGAGKLFRMLVLVLILSQARFSQGQSQQAVPPQVFSGPTNRPPQLYSGTVNRPAEIYSGPTHRPPPLGTVPPPVGTIPNNQVTTVAPIAPSNPPPIATIPIQTVTITNQVVGTVTTNIVLIPGSTTITNITAPIAAPAPAPNPAQNLVDQRLNQQITQAIQAHEVNVLLPNIRITTMNGKVTLQGVVEDRQTKYEMVTIAQNIAGSQNVTDELSVQRNP